MTKEALYQKISKNKMPNHIAIILDGNGRWATSRGLPRNMGHQKGIKTLIEIVKVAAKIGIKNLTVFAFSTENWSRPTQEVDFLMNEFEKFYTSNQKSFNEHNIRVKVIGEKNNLSLQLLKAIVEVEEKTKHNNRLILNVAFNYGARQELLSVVKEIVREDKKPAEINLALIEEKLYTNESGPVDLLIRTSGEVRISNFLLWQISYSELYFTKTYWPDFHEKEFYLAIYEYFNRNRRFGGLDK